MTTGDSVDLGIGFGAVVAATLGAGFGGGASAMKYYSVPTTIGINLTCCELSYQRLRNDVQLVFTGLEFLGACSITSTGQR